MPFIGQLFRSSDSQREKQELVILVTPSIVDDEVGGSYGYGYRPSTKEARQLMGSTSEPSAGMNSFIAIGSRAWEVERRPPYADPTPLPLCLLFSSPVFVAAVLN